MPIVDEDVAGLRKLFTDHEVAEILGHGGADLADALMARLEFGLPARITAGQVRVAEEARGRVAERLVRQVLVAVAALAERRVSKELHRAGVGQAWQLVLRVMRQKG